MATVNTLDSTYGNVGGCMFCSQPLTVYEKTYGRSKPRTEPIKVVTVVQASQYSSELRFCTSCAKRIAPEFAELAAWLAA